MQILGIFSLKASSFHTIGGDLKMLRSMKDMEQYAIHATDGVIGHIDDFYFDDKTWVIRYLVVETGSWLSSRKVLISPIAIGHPNWVEKILPVSVTKEQVKNSPDIDTAKPVSRQHEIQYLGYYGYPFYWGGAGLWGEGTYPNLMMQGDSGFVSSPSAVPSGPKASRASPEIAKHPEVDPHLRSCKEVMSYHLQASDGDIGHVESLLVDEETWAIRYMIADTSNWWTGHLVPIATQWIRAVSWSEATVSVDFTQQAVKDAPPYDSAAALDRVQEEGIHEHYGRSGYWTAERKRDTATAHP